MEIWDKVREGIDKVGKAAQDVLDEAKLRIDAYRAREQADKAEAFGYAVFRAEEALGQPIEPAARDCLLNSLRERDGEAKRLEATLAAGRAAGEAKAGGKSDTAGAWPNRHLNQSPALRATPLLTPRQIPPAPRHRLIRLRPRSKDHRLSPRANP